MNESFRKFVEGTDHAEEIAMWEKQERQSTWHAFRFIALAVAVVGAAWLFYTQAAYSQTVVGYIAAIGTLLATLGSLFGRSARPTSSKSE